MAKQNTPLKVFLFDKLNKKRLRLKRSSFLQFNEDNFKDDEPTSGPVIGGPSVSESEIGNLLSKNQVQSRLFYC